MNIEKTVQKHLAMIADLDERLEPSRNEMGMCPDCFGLKRNSDRICPECGGDTGRTAYRNLMAGLVVMPGEEGV